MSTTFDFGSRIGLGLGRVGSDDVSDEAASAVMSTAFELGVRVFDAAPSYGHAERRLGDFARRVGREQLVISTKCGYGVPGVPDWTYECIERGVDLARQRMGLDVIDVMHLHSCPRSTLEGAGVLEALFRAREAGKVRAVAYSGEGDALALAVEVCDIVQCSVNVADQGCLDTTLRRALERGVRVLAKRPIASGAWRAGDAADTAARVYRERLAKMGLDFGPRWLEVAVRFSAFAPGVSACLVGTSSAAHLEAIAASVKLGPLPDGELRALREAFVRNAADWGGQI